MKKPTRKPKAQDVPPLNAGYPGSVANISNSTVTMGPETTIEHALAVSDIANAAAELGRALRVAAKSLQPSKGKRTGIHVGNIEIEQK